MQELDPEKCGALIARLRKEKGLTQKQVARELMLSDKAVSKWERGLSMPDIALLIPLSKLLGVTTTELLRGERTEAEAMVIGDVEQLVSSTIRLSGREGRAQKRKLRRQRLAVLISCVFAVVLEAALLSAMGCSAETLRRELLPVEVLALLFGAWFSVFAKETLPAYYDENKISAYSDGIFRMHLPGVHFNNSNWPHILAVGSVWMLTLAVVFPMAYLVLTHFSAGAWACLRRPLQMFAFFGFFAAVFLTAKRYE